MARGGGVRDFDVKGGGSVRVWVPDLDGNFPEGAPEPDPDETDDEIIDRLLRMRDELE